jgi:Domain of unknown function (DUF4062)
MPQVEKLKIFLASPSDVRAERNHVFKVVEELNRTIASYKGVVLEVICSENAYPGYGKDGQAIINEQIGKMSDYVLFIGIMWNRFGTPTKRAKSGTMEEYQRARRTFKSKGQPTIWFYFRSMTEGLEKKVDLEQQKEVERFKNRYQKAGYSLGLSREYKTPHQFRDKLRVHLTDWLNQRSKKRSRKSSNSSKTVASLSTNKASARKLQSDENSKQVSLTSNVTTKKQASTNKSTTKPTPKTNKSIGDSGAWVLLDDYLFEAQSVNTLGNQHLVLNIPVLNAEKEANLRKLQPNNQFYSKRQITYAYQNDASMVQVESIETQSIKGKTCYIVNLKPTPQSYNNNIVSYSGYTYEQTAELRIRFLLLNETPKSQDRSHQSALDYILRGNDYPLNPKGCIFNDIWKKWKNEPKMFLINARLAAISYLKINHIVEHILDLKISFTSNNVISIQFRGQLKQFYSNQEASVVQVKGKCTLDS